MVDNKRDIPGRDYYFNRVDAAVLQWLSELRPQELEGLRRAVKFHANAPEELEEFLLEIRAEDVKSMRQVIEVESTVRRSFRIMKWMVLSLVAAFLTLTQMGQAMKRWLVWLTHGG